MDNPSINHLTQSTIGRLKLAEKTLFRIIARRWLPRAHLAQAKLRRAEGQFARAVSSCESALRLDASNPDIHLHYALNLMALQHDNGAIAALDQVLKLRPFDPTALHLLKALHRQPSQSAPVGYVERLFNRFADTFDHRMNGAVNYRVPTHLTWRIELIAKQRSRFDCALDLGCGTGLSGDALKPYTRHLTGVDLSRKMLDKASHKMIYDVLVCDEIIHFLNRCKATFDLITAADVFIYMGDLTSVFRSVQQRLDPDGIFAFSTERARFAAYRLKKSGRFAHSPNYIYRLADKHGFSVLYRDTIKLRLEHHQWQKGDFFVLGGTSPMKKKTTPTPRAWKRFGRFLFPQ
jgi:predicted TPR repeat methyltransferase